MQSNSTTARHRRRLLVVELWGIGDVALAVPFLRAASQHVQVTLLAKPHAEPVLRRFCPEVELVPLAAPWTAFTGKYQLHRWPWSDLLRVVGGLRSRRFHAAISARPDPRDHALMALAGAGTRLGFPRAGSEFLLSHPVARPTLPHRAQHWRAIAAELGWTIPHDNPPPRTGRHVVIHTGAGHIVREWPRERYAEIAHRLSAAGWSVTVSDPADGRTLDELIELLASADRFIGNDSGPGHLAALLGVPTFTIFGPQLPELFVPQHPAAAHVPGGACPFKPCFDSCRFAAPNCILELRTEDVGARISAWLDQSAR